MASRRPPLEGLVVLDLSRVLAGPLATMVLADLGARVVKVEDPRGGDVTRSWSPPSVDGEAAYFLSVNRRKESAAVDLGSEVGREFVKRWAARADVLVENFLPGALDKFGLSLESLRAANPRLVVCSISGYGPDGPLASAPGFDLLAQGASGLMSITGPAGGPPHKAGVALSDVLTGWAAATSILAALAARARDGAGSHVLVDLFSSTLAALVNVAQNALVTGADPPRFGNAHPSIEPYRLFEAKNGPFLLAVGTDRQFERLATNVLVRPDLANDPRFATNEKRIENRAALAAILEPAFAAATRDSWLSRCLAEGIPAGPVSGVHEALTSDQARAIGTILEVSRPGRPPLPTVRPPFILRDFTLPEATAPPRLDEDGERLYAEIGLVSPARDS